MDQVRIGLIGTGFIADWHLAGFAGLPQARVLGIARDFYGDDSQRLDQRAQLRQKSERWGVRAYANVDELMEDPDVDAVVVGSINPLHLGHIEQAIDLGDARSTLRIIEAAYQSAGARTLVEWSE
jgi:predicted dehydrogenase